MVAATSGRRYLVLKKQILLKWTVNRSKWTKNPQEPQLGREIFWFMLIVKQEPPFLLRLQSSSIRYIMKLWLTRKRSRIWQSKSNSWKQVILNLRQVSEQSKKWRQNLYTRLPENLKLKNKEKKSIRLVIKLKLRDSLAVSRLKATTWSFLRKSISEKQVDWQKKILLYFLRPRRRQLKQKFKSKKN